ncbi:MAG: B-box zinc finger protein [Chloroflexi bacterium]|nr:B-box zinc finger protein [Chloroflexota bacterium]
MAVPCPRHPGTETALRCSKCETPICPRCFIQTPVGARCRDCARLKRVPTYDVAPILIVRGLAASVGAGLALGFAWLYLAQAVRFVLFLDLLVAAGVGYLIAEAATRAARLKSGPALQAVASLGMVVAYLPQLFVTGIQPLGVLGLVIGLAVVISRLR